MAGSKRSKKLTMQQQEEDVVGKTNSHPPLLLFSCQDLFAKIAEATGESLESVCQMQEAERNGQLEVLGLKKEPRSLTIILYRCHTFICHLCFWWRLKTLEWKFVQIVFAQNVCCDKIWEKRWQEIKGNIEISVFVQPYFGFWVWSLLKIFWQCWFMTDPSFQSWLRSRSCQVRRIFDKRRFSAPEAQIKHCLEMMWEPLSVNMIFVIHFSTLPQNLNFPKIIGWGWFIFLLTIWGKLPFDCLTTHRSWLLTFREQLLFPNTSSICPTSWLRVNSGQLLLGDASWLRGA